jgi:hypothetical protein
MQGIEKPNINTVMSKFVPPSESDLIEHVKGFGSNLKLTDMPDRNHLRRICTEVGDAEGHIELIMDWFNPKNLMVIKVPGDTSPGIRWKKLGYRNKKEALRPAVLEASRIVQRMIDTGEGYSVPPCGVAGRGKRVDTLAVSSDNEKKPGRLIVIPDLVRHLIGSMASKGVSRSMSRTRKENGGVMLGMGPFDSNYSRISEWTKGADAFLFIDFKKFDQSIPGFVITHAFQCAKRHLESAPGSKGYWKSEYDQLVNTEICLPSGDVYRKDRGVASGDPWTSIIGSYANLIMLKYALDVLNLSGKVWTFGDDSIIAVYNNGSSKEQLMSSMATVLKRSFGVTVSVKKSYPLNFLVGIDSAPIPKVSGGSFLSMYFTWTSSGVMPTRPTQDLHELMLKPEKYHRDVGWEIARTVMAYLVFYWNEDARSLLEDYWDYLHSKYKMPEMVSRQMVWTLTKEHDIPFERFQLNWLLRLPDAAEVEFLYKYGHTQFFEPRLGTALYSDVVKDIGGNVLFDYELAMKYVP